MSPEQARGLEVFSCGVLLHQLATLELPFGGSNPLAVMQEASSKPAPAIAETGTDLPPGFQQVVDKALAKGPDLRYQSMKEALRDLNALGGGRTFVRMIAQSFDLAALADRTKAGAREMQLNQMKRPSMKFRSRFPPNTPV